MVTKLGWVLFPTTCVSPCAYVSKTNNVETRFVFPETENTLFSQKQKGSLFLVGGLLKVLKHKFSKQLGMAT